MHWCRGFMLAGVLSLVGAAVQAGDVSIKGVHLCCGACVKDATAALEGVDGLTGIGMDRNTKVIVFKATDEKAAQAAIEELAEAGFHGTATFDKKVIAFPASGAEKGAKANLFVVTGVHLCCGACVTGAQKALEDVPGLAEAKIDRAAKTITLTGNEVEIAAAIGALNKAGFHATLKKEKAAK